jgi:hypothetical protein
VCLADLVVAVIQRQDPGRDARGVLTLLVERCRQDEVLPGGMSWVAMDHLLLEAADKVVDIVQSVVLDVEGVTAEAGAVGDRTPPCQKFARNCATRNLVPPHAPHSESISDCAVV